MINKARDSLYVSLIVFLHPLWCYLLIYRTDMGVGGAGLANSITYTMILVLSHVYISKQEDIQESWFRPTAACLIGMGAYCKRGMWTAIRVCLEMWSYEIMILMSTFLSDEDTSSQIICNNFI